ncbi:MAG TPA: hypothetical protein VFM49_15640 [Chloroflexia bacterium]|jgi:hypothetical protein|nr:hypothetical protein [Chloroflexia bacterium]
MITHEYLLDRLSREITAERVQEAKNARMARIVAAVRRENAGLEAKRQSLRRETASKATA